MFAFQLGGNIDISHRCMRLFNTLVTSTVPVVERAPKLKFNYIEI